MPLAGVDEDAVADGREKEGRIAGEAAHEAVDRIRAIQLRGVFGCIEVDLTEARRRRTIGRKRVETNAALPSLRMV